MPTYLERYLAGEHEAVWADLTALGAKASDPPVHDDALAVARETMGRARRNIEKIVARLEEMGYEFGNEPPSATALNPFGGLAGLLAGVDRQKVAGVPHMLKLMAALGKAAAAPAKPKAKPRPAQDPNVFAAADQKAAGRVAKFEKRLGHPLPLSLRAWYETIDSVSLIGRHPRLNPAEDTPSRPTLVISPQAFSFPGGEEMFEQQKRQMEAMGFQLATAAAPEMNEDPLADPLVVFPLDALEDELEDGAENCAIAPDELHKANISGDCYYIQLEAAADVRFDDWHKTTFVGYLREAFRWGGFPGWSRTERRPVEEIERLRAGLEEL